jgi:hypothetical protein
MSESNVPEVKISEIKAGATVSGEYLRASWDAPIQMTFHVVAVCIVRGEARLLGTRNPQDASDSALQLIYARGFAADGSTEIADEGNELDVDTSDLYIVPVNPRYPYLRRFESDKERNVAVAVYDAAPFDDYKADAVSFAHL